MNLNEEMHPARWWKKTSPRTQDAKSVTCLLCPRGCVLKNNSSGFCGARKNIGGKLFALTYGRPAALAMDPIEKKPLYHFHPGAETLSLGALGCNMRCPHCQNDALSFASESDFTALLSAKRGILEGFKKLWPVAIAQIAMYNNSKIISWTYNEPLVWPEYVLDCMRAAREQSLSSVLVTAGLVHPDIWEEFLPFLDACSLDIKGWGDFYTKLTGINGLECVLQNALAAHKAGCHIEIVTNIMHGWNDDTASLTAIAEWICDKLSPNIPWHVTASRPAHTLTELKPTPLETIRKAVALGKKIGLQFVYSGNIADTETQITFCPNCGAELIKRASFFLRENRFLNGGRCSKCGTRIYGVFD